MKVTRGRFRLSPDRRDNDRLFIEYLPGGRPHFLSVENTEAVTLAEALVEWIEANAQTSQ